MGCHSYFRTQTLQIYKGPLALPKDNNKNESNNNKDNDDRYNNDVHIGVFENK